MIVVEICTSPSEKHTYITVTAMHQAGRRREQKEGLLYVSSSRTIRLKEHYMARCSFFFRLRELMSPFIGQSLV